MNVEEHQNFTGIMPVFEAYQRGEPIILGNGTVLWKCVHVEFGEIPDATEGLNVWLNFTYCPKCGEKL
jgi:hypothetical protein